MERRKTQNREGNTKEEQSQRIDTVQDFEIFCKVTVTMTMRYWWKDRRIRQQNTVQK